MRKCCMRVWKTTIAFWLQLCSLDIFCLICLGFYLCVFLVKWVLLNFDIWSLHLYDMAAPQPPKQGRIWSLKLLVAQCDIPTSCKTRNQFRKDLVVIRNPYASLNKYLQFVPFRKRLGCKADLSWILSRPNVPIHMFSVLHHHHGTKAAGQWKFFNGSFYSGSRRFCQWIVIFPKIFGWRVGSSLQTFSMIGPWKFQYSFKKMFCSRLRGGVVCKTLRLKRLAMRMDLPGIKNCCLAKLHPFHCLCQA